MIELLLDVSNRRTYSEWTKGWEAHGISDPLTEKI